MVLGGRLFLMSEVPLYLRLLRHTRLHLVKVVHAAGVVPPDCVHHLC